MFYLMLISSAVLGWLGELNVIENVEDRDMLAIIHIESTGDPYAKRHGSQYYGLLQVSDAYMQDALEYAGKEIVRAEVLHGDGAKSLRVFRWYMHRYSHLHEWKPELVALIHKCGPGGLAEILEGVENGLTMEESIKLNDTPGALDYLKKFRRYRVLYGNSISSE